MYDTNIGRFLSEDPLQFDADDENLYRYVGNNPTNLVDPSGLFPPPLGRYEGGCYIPYSLPGQPCVRVPLKTETFADKITANKEKYISDIIAVLSGKKSAYLNCINSSDLSTDVTRGKITDSDYDQASLEFANAYVACMISFAKRYPNARPAVGERNFSYQGWSDYFNDVPWCADYCDFFTGGYENAAPCLETAIFKSKKAKTIFQLYEGQHHYSMTTDKPQHNFGFLYPVGCAPKLQPGIPLPGRYGMLVPDPKNPRRPLSTNDDLIIIIDPWLTASPVCYPIDKYIAPPTNSGDLNIQ